MSVIFVGVLTATLAAAALLLAFAFIRHARRENLHARLCDLQSLETRDWRTSGSSE